MTETLAEPGIEVLDRLRGFGAIKSISDWTDSGGPVQCDPLDG